MKKALKDLATKTIQELRKEEQTIRLELAHAKLENAVHAPKDTNTLMKKRKKLAVILTLLTEKKMQEKTI